MKRLCILEEAKEKIKSVIKEKGVILHDAPVKVRPLSPVEAIGKPKMQDLPILKGKERVVEASISSFKGHAFTDSPGSFDGSLSDVLELDLSSNFKRAVFISVLNAVCCQLGIVQRPLHCKDKEPHECGEYLANKIFYYSPRGKVGLIGLNPAIASPLVDAFGKKFVMISDLNPDNIGKEKFGVKVKDGNTDNEEIIQKCKTLLVTGTTLANGTIDQIIKWIGEYQRDYWVYGITACGVSRLLDLKHVCPFARSL